MYLPVDAAVNDLDRLVWTDLTGTVGEKLYKNFTAV